MKHPSIIQGGMGVAVSNYRLARAVSKEGHLGVVSGTMLDTVLARRLQDGDPAGSLRRAIEKFPLPNIGESVLSNYFIDGGKDPAVPYKVVPMHGVHSPSALIELTILANFVEVFLAKEDHDGVVGINYLTKIELPTLPSLFGAMLAGVDYVLMGAGIPRAIPAILQQLSKLETVVQKLDILGSSSGDHCLQFDPRDYAPAITELPLPYFLPIVSSSTLAQALLKKAVGKIDGFVVEHHRAGGHNAPPRGGITLDDKGEPIYGMKDEIDTEAFCRLGLPFWLAGSCAHPDKLKEALQLGAQGIQVGTAFAFCNESGILPSLKKEVITKVAKGEAEVFTDPRASASGYPFKVVELDGSLSDKRIYENRTRICDLGYLRTAYQKEDGTVGFRCPGEPVDTYLRKGGSLEETDCRKCLCNGLMATVGYAQVQKDGYKEPPLVTAGKELAFVADLLPAGRFDYSAKDVLNFLLKDNSNRP
ncbi:MAG: nitronate monooxygenase [Candidatus Obscuribacterales bacterium]